MKIQIIAELFVTKSLFTTPINVLPLHLKQTFPPTILIFTKGEVDGIKSSLSFKIFSTLPDSFLMKANKMHSCKNRVTLQATQ